MMKDFTNIYQSTNIHPLQLDKVTSDNLSQWLVPVPLKHCLQFFFFFFYKSVKWNILKNNLICSNIWFLSLRYPKDGLGNIIG